MTTLTDIAAELAEVKAVMQAVNERLSRFPAQVGFRAGYLRVEVLKHGYQRSSLNNIGCRSMSAISTWPKSAALILAVLRPRNTPR